MRYITWRWVKNSNKTLCSVLLNKITKGLLIVIWWIIDSLIRLSKNISTIIITLAHRKKSFSIYLCNWSDVKPEEMEEAKSHNTSESVYLRITLGWSTGYLRFHKQHWRKSNISVQL